MAAFITNNKKYLGSSYSVLLVIYTTIIILGLGSFTNIFFKDEMNLLFIVIWSLLAVINKSKITYRQVIYILIFNIQILSITIFHNSVETLAIIFLVMKIALIAYSITFYNRQISIFFNYLTFSIFWLSALSNLIYILVIIGFPIPLIKVANTNSYLLLNAGYGIDFGYFWGLIRNSGVFYEPGLYQFVLSLSCIWSVQLKRTGLTLYFFITLLSTFSIVAFVNALIILVFYISQFGKYHKFVLFGLFVFGGFYFLDHMANLFALKSDTVSYALRLTDLMQGWSMFLDRPILGYGPSFVAENYTDGNLRGNSNGIWGILHQFGITGAVMLLILFGCTLYKGLKTLLLVIITTLATQNIFQSDFFLTLLTFIVLARPVRETRIEIST